MTRWHLIVTLLLSVSLLGAVAPCQCVLTMLASGAEHGTCCQPVVPLQEAGCCPASTPREDGPGFKGTSGHACLCASAQPAGSEPAYAVPVTVSKVSHAATANSGTSALDAPVGSRRPVAADPAFPPHPRAIYLISCSFLC
jgi:hypothetical protein